MTSLHTLTLHQSPETRTAYSSPHRTSGVALTLTDVGVAHTARAVRVATTGKVERTCSLTFGVVWSTAWPAERRRKRRNSGKPCCPSARLQNTKPFRRPTLFTARLGREEQRVGGATGRVGASCGCPLHTRGGGRVAFAPKHGCEDRYAAARNSTANHLGSRRSNFWASTPS